MLVLCWRRGLRRSSPSWVWGPSQGPSASLLYAAPRSLASNAKGPFLPFSHTRIPAKFYTRASHNPVDKRVVVLWGKIHQGCFYHHSTDPFLSVLSIISERRFSPVSLLGTTYKMKLVIQPYPVDKQTLHRQVLSSLFLVKAVSLSHDVCCFSVLLCPATSEGHHTQRQRKL